MTIQDSQSEIETFLKFLDGSGQYKGRWFGDRPSGVEGAYFWRKDLRPIIEAYVTTRVKEAERLARVDELRTPYTNGMFNKMGEAHYQNRIATLTTTNNGKEE